VAAVACVHAGHVPAQPLGELRGVLFVFDREQERLAALELLAHLLIIERLLGAAPGDQINVERDSCAWLGWPPPPLEDDLVDAPDRLDPELASRV
jgi:hypothetical protein